MNKIIDLYESTNNRNFYNKLRKRYLADQFLIHCSRCSYHKRENASKKDHRSWKRYRLTQYKEKS